MAVIKTYASAETAQKIADKLFAKSGIPNQILETAPGKWVITDVAPEEKPEPTEQPTDDKKDVAPVETINTGTPEVVSPASATTKVNATDTVTIEIEGAKLTAQYVITPVLGAKPRWFERKRLDSAEAITGGVRVTCSTKELTSRGLGHLLTQMDAKANAPETHDAPAEAVEAFNQAVEKAVA